MIKARWAGTTDFLTGQSFLSFCLPSKLHVESEVTKRWVMVVALTPQCHPLVSIQASEVDTQTLPPVAGCVAGARTPYWLATLPLLWGRRGHKDLPGSPQGWMHPFWGDELVAHMYRDALAGAHTEMTQSESELLHFEEQITDKPVLWVRVIVTSSTAECLFKCRGVQDYVWGWGMLRKADESLLASSPSSSILPL